MRPLAYDIVPHGSGAGAKFTCAKCDETLVVAMPSPHNPAKIVNAAKARGWEVTANSKRRCLCPTHSKRTRTKLAGTPPHTREQEQPTPLSDWLVQDVLPHVEPAPEPIVQEPTPEPKEPVIEMTSPLVPADADLVPITASAVPPQRVLTPAQKAKVRDKLDMHYDIERGCYTGGQSDQQIGKDLKVPWALVAQMREAAYGPLLVDPETEALHADAARLRKELEDNAGDILKLMGVHDRLQKELGSLTSRINALSLVRKK